MKRSLGLLYLSLFPHSSASYLPGIDGLRAIAVLSVMLYHLKSEILVGGFVGVDVFFVISGYVVAKSILGQRFISLKELLLYFYARRFIRVVPALVLMLLVGSVLTVAFIPDAWLSEVNRTTAFYAFFGLSNVRLALLDDYFGPRTDFNPFVHTWSLGVEEQFYLIFPFIVAATVLPPYRKKPALVTALALTVASLVTSAAFTGKYPVFSFFQIPGRFWELGIGLLLALTEPRWVKSIDGVKPSALTLFGLISLSFLGLSFAFCDEKNFPFPWALVPVISTAALLAIVSARRHTVISAILSMPPLVFLGLISYSLYLWHWPIYALFRWTSGLETIAEQAGALSFTVLAALASYFLIERPVRISQQLSKLPRFAVVSLFGVLIVSSALISRGAFALHQTLSLSVTADEDIWKSKLPKRTGCVVTERELATSACASLNRVKLIVVGDSHAGAYERLIGRLSAERDISVFLYSMAGCPFLNLRDSEKTLPEKCVRFNAFRKTDLLEKASSSTFIFFPDLRIDRLRDQSGSPNKSMPAVNDAAIEEARAILRPLSDHGATLVLEAPTPVFWSAPFRCSDWFNNTNPACKDGFLIERRFFESLRSDVLGAERRLAASIPRVFIWDPAETLCSAQRCNAFDRDGPLFYDSDHLSGHGNDVLYPAFVDLLKRF
jgi:peptidoglycan/LPS O-acetylase OafA/YrhL